MIVVWMLVGFWCCYIVATPNFLSPKLSSPVDVPCLSHPSAPPRRNQAAPCTRQSNEAGAMSHCGNKSGKFHAELVN